MDDGIMMVNRKSKDPTSQQVSTKDYAGQGRIFSVPELDKCLDAIQLFQLEQSFRKWTDAASRMNVLQSRQRVLIIFLMIRYSGAKLNEVLQLDPFQDIDFVNQFVLFGRKQEKSCRSARKVLLPKALCEEIQSIITSSAFQDTSRNLLDIDPGFVRRKFYDRAEACGMDKQLGAPEILRKSRAVELMQRNLPLPAVQMLLGHSTPSLISSYVSFSSEDIEQVTRMYLERESTRKTSARNSFFGKIQNIQHGGIQTRVELVTYSGKRVVTVITRDSFQRLGLKKGQMITAEVKAPWIMLQKSCSEPKCSADNMYAGHIVKIHQGEINTEYIVRISDGTEVCSLVTCDSGRHLSFEKGEPVWVLFNSYSVVLLVE